MKELMYRPALAADEQAISTLRTAYLHGLYRGFVSKQMITDLTDKMSGEPLFQWMRTGEFEVDVALHKDTLRGFIAYGDSGEPGVGQIRDFGCLDDCDSQERWAIVEHSLHQLAARGFRDAFMWVLVDNFRVRFLFESMGFRPDGGRRTEIWGDLEICLARYRMHLTR